MAVSDLVGKKYVFPDGNALEIIQVKRTDLDRGGHLITYLIHQGSLNLPRKLVMGTRQFVENFGHLFDIDYSDDRDE